MHLSSPPQKKNYVSSYLHWNNYLYYQIKRAKQSLNAHCPTQTSLLSADYRDFGTHLYLCGPCCGPCCCSGNPFYRKLHSWCSDEGPGDHHLYYTTACYHICCYCCIVHYRYHHTIVLQPVDLINVRYFLRVLLHSQPL